MPTTQFKLPDMDCPGCIEKVERTIGELDGVQDVSASLMSQVVHITHNGNDPQDFKMALQAIGYMVAEDARVVLSVPDMECAGCAEKVEMAIRGLDGVSDVITSVMSQKVTVMYVSDAVNKEGISAVVRDAGYTPGEGSADEFVTQSFWRNPEKVFTVVSGIFFFIGLITTWMFPEAEHGPLWTGHLGWTEVFYLIAAVIGGLNFFPAGFRALRTLSLDMDFLMTAAIFGAVLIGEHMEAAAIAFLFSTAELLEDYAIDRARNSLRSLMQLAPDVATVKREGVESVVSVEDVERDEIVVVRPGEKISVDGKVVAGVSSVDQSPITGESMPVDKGVGDAVFAGAMNQEGYLEVQTTHLASESTLSRMMQMVEEAEERRAPSEQFVRKFSRYYTPAVTLLALGVILIPTLVLGGEFTMWCMRGLTLLVIACPCALVISTPIAVVSGITSAARNGVLIKGGNYLEALGDVRVVVFDKTGTLTHGKPAVTDVIPVNGWKEQDVLRTAAALEQRSGHPIARAITAQANGEKLPDVADFESITGKGLRGRIGDEVCVVGKPDLFPEGGGEVSDRLQQEGKTVVLVGTESEVKGVVAVADTVREQAKMAIEALHRQGIERVVLLTGDHEVTARVIAKDLGVDDWKAGLLPQEKVEALEDLRRQYGPVAMVGDGANDAPALATASVGIAMGAAGTDTALETADVALMADDLSKLPYLFQLSHASRRVIRQNVVAAILIKVILAAGVIPGAVSLVVAVLAGDMGAALGVTGNALRLARLKAE